MSHMKSKPILRHFHLIEKIVARADVVVERIALINNISDPLTKPLAEDVFKHHCITMVLMQKGDWL